MSCWTVVLLFVLLLAYTGDEAVSVEIKSFYRLVLIILLETGLQGAHLFIWQQEADLSTASESCLLGVLIVSRETLLGIL